MATKSNSATATVLETIISKMLKKRVRLSHSMHYDRRLDTVIKITAEVTGVQANEITSKRRQFSMPRHIAMYIGVEVLGLSLSEVSRPFGVDHTSVWYAHNKIKNRGRGRSKLNTALNEVVKRVA
jgi:chromosomal replication initiation ATPase DnaA